MERILPGEVAWYVTGRFYASADDSGAAFDAGYFVHLQGVEGPLFSGAPGEGTAYLTFLADPFTKTTVVNGGISLGLDPVGEFGVYLNRQPGATFSDPASFGAREEVARFRRVSVVMGATVAAELAAASSASIVSLNVFSAQLIRSREFELGGRRYDLRRLMPNGVTQWGTAAVAATGTPPGIPFVGSAIAIGGEPRIS